MVWALHCRLVVGDVSSRNALRFSRDALCLLILSGVLILSQRGDAQVQCYSAVDCPAGDLVATVLTVKECCLGQKEDGLYYSSGGEVCTQCVVYGFDIPGQPLESPTFTAVESYSEAYSLPIRMIKGNVGPSKIDINTEVLPGGTAMEGDLDDFFIDNKSVQLLPGNGTSLLVTFRVDGLALEPDETFQLKLSTSEPVPTDENYFFVDILGVTIEDPDGIEVVFSESNYSAAESYQEVIVTVQTVGNRTTPVTLKVTPLNYDDFISLDKPLPSDFPYVPSSNDYFDVPLSEITSPNRAMAGKDFSNMSHSVTFPAANTSSVTQISLSIPVNDDSINEGNEVFVVILELVDAVDQSRVDLSIRNATLVWIGDNDPIQIDFEFSSYTYTESDSTAVINIVKSIESEQTFNVVVQTSGYDAIHNVDYSIGDTEEVLFVFTPGQDTILFPFILFDDNSTEGTETFLLIILQQEGSVADFNTFNPVTTIYIVDPVVMELVPGEITVLEDVGEIEFTLSVIVPEDFEVLPAIYIFVFLEIESDSADENDYLLISSPFGLFDDKHRSFNFTVRIIDDDISEPPEDFFLTIHGDEYDDIPLQIVPNISIITIMDNPTVLAELTAESDVVSEGDVVVLCVTVVDTPPGAHLSGNVLIYAFIEGDTADISDVDPEDGSYSLEFTFNQNNCFSIYIAIDGLVEFTERFSVRAEIAGPNDFLEINPSQPHITILDSNSTFDDLVVDIPPLIKVNEDEDATITIRLQGRGSVTMGYSTVDLTALAGEDYYQLLAEDSFVLQDPGSNLTDPQEGIMVQTQTVKIVRDDVLENTEETLQLNISINSTSNQVLFINGSVATVVIVDDDAIGFQFTNTPYTVLEGAGSVTVTVEMIGDTRIPVTSELSVIPVNSELATVSLLAIGGADYEAVDQSLSFSGTNKVQQVNIVIIDDNDTDVDDKIFCLQLSYNAKTYTSCVTIMEDDYVVVGFGSLSYNVTEQAGQVLTFEIVKGSSTSVSIVVHIETMFLGSAFPDCPALGTSIGDYESELNVSDITLQPNENSITATMLIINDYIEEETEMFRLVLTVDRAKAIVTQSEPEILDVTIIDDDRVSVAFETDSYEVRESAGGVEICVKRDNGTVIPYTVNVSTVPLEAQEDDFLALDGLPIVFNSSQEGKKECIVLQIVDDKIALEGEETFLVNLSIPDDSQLMYGKITVANVTIIDEDVVSVQFTDQTYVVEDDGMAEVSLIISTSIARSMNVTVIVSVLSTNGTEGMTNFSDSKVLTFSPTSNLSYTTFDLRDAPDLEFLNISFELPDDVAALVAVGDGAWATFHKSIPSSIAIQLTSTPIVTPSSIMDADSSTDSQSAVPFAVGGSVLVVVVVLLVVMVAVIGYLRWKAYAYKMRPKMQGAATPLSRLTRLHALDEDKSRQPKPFVRGTTCYLKRLEESKQHIPGNRIHLLNCIGKGQFGIVYCARLTGWVDGASDGIVAVKTLKAVHCHDDVDAILRESLKMRDFNHPHVLSLIGVSLDAGDSPYIVMPFMANGSLLNHLRKERPNLTIDDKAPEELIQDARRQLLSMCLQITKGMEYLAARKVVHRDLAARNCMIDADGVIKVADFGLSEDLYTKSYFREGGEEVKLPVKWMAIESLRDCVFTEKTDVWSFGVTCWEVFSLGTMPYPGVNHIAVLRYLLEGGRLEVPMNAACSDEVYEILQSCWEFDPEKRPTFSELVCTVTTLLEGVAGYMPLKAFSPSVRGDHPGAQEWSDETAIAHVEEILQLQESEAAC